MGPTAVVLHCERDDEFLRGHEACTLTHVARRLAGMLGAPFAGRHDPRRRYPGKLYVFAVDPLLPEQARALDITTPADVFGSVVPHAVVATKAITHPLVHPRAGRPAGWSTAFSAAVRRAVLPGYTVFSRRCARSAATRLLASGAVRVKDPRGAGSRGQVVVRSLRDVDALLEAWDTDALARHGLVLERNLARLRSLSIGQISAAGLLMSYHGEQRETTDGEGRAAYGGSDLVCVRGGWDALERLELGADVREAVAQARVYDAAAAVFPGFLASRRNYDVGQGVDADGRRWSGVFEASWRPGGASGAEIAALEALLDPDVERVHVSTVERHGADLEAPAEACVHFNRVDPSSGPALRYTHVTRVERRAA